MDNFDWEAFKAGKIAVNCRTEEDARDFIAQLIDQGITRWSNEGEIDVEDHSFDLNGSGTCYYVHEDGDLLVSRNDYVTLKIVEWQPKIEPGACYGMSAIQTYTPSSISEAKHDTGKPRLTLVPSQIMYDIAEVREYGLKKYGDPENWRKVDKKRYFDAMFRHWLEFLKDPQSVDAESGIEHYKHVACNVAFICELMKEV